MQKKNFKFLILRFFNVYGPRQSKYFLISKIIDKCKKNKLCKIYFPGNQTRCFTFVDDVINFMTSLSLIETKYNEVINIGSNKKSRVIQIVKLIKKLTKSKSKIKIVKLNKINNTTFKDVINRQPDITKIKKLYKWKPSTKIEDGIKKTISFFNN